VLERLGVLELTFRRHRYSINDFFESASVFHLAYCVELSLERQPIQLIDPQAGE